MKLVLSSVDVISLPGSGFTEEYFKALRVVTCTVAKTAEVKQVHYRSYFAYNLDSWHGVVKSPWLRPPFLNFHVIHFMCVPFLYV